MYAEYYDGDEKYRRDVFIKTDLSKDKNFYKWILIYRYTYEPDFL